MDLREGIELCDSVSSSLGTDRPAESPYSALFWYPLKRAGFASVGGPSYHSVLPVTDGKSV